MPQKRGAPQLYVGYLQLFRNGDSMRVKSWEGWSGWATFGNLNGVPETPGAYIIGTKQSIARLSGQDKNGILSIGETDNLLKRLQMFLACADGNRHRGHTAGWRYRELNLHKLFPITSLHFRWKSALSKEEAYSLEGELLKEYASQHLELPPLNYKYNWSGHSH